MSNLQPRISVYLPALIHGLELYHAGFKRLVFPDYVQAVNASDAAAAMIHEAESWCLPVGIKREFTPADPFPLRPVFDDIYLDHFNPQSKKFDLHQPRGKSNTFFPFKALSLDQNNIFPKPVQPTKQEYDQLWADFETEFEKLKKLTTSEYTFTASLIYLLKKYTSCVPVSKNLDTVSLYEFLKVRAAIAECLWRVGQSGEAPDKPVLMVAVGVTGIQDFIYNIASSKAARSLKGRSFYLQLLMESVIQKIIRDDAVKLTEGQVLYASGGKMYLFLPNLKPVREALAKIEQEIVKEIFEQYKTGLYVCFEQCPIDKELCLTPDQPWEGLEKALNAKKWRKFEYRSDAGAGKKNMLVENFDALFLPDLEDGYDDAADRNETKKRTCAVSGDIINIEADEKAYVLNEQDDVAEWVFVAREIKNQKELGDDLMDAEYFTTVKGSIPLSKKGERYIVEPVNLGIIHYLKDEHSIVSEVRKFAEPHSLKQSLIRLYNNTNFVINAAGINTLDGSAFGFAFYGGNRQACRKDEHGHDLKKNGRLVLKDYEEIAGYEPGADKGRGFHRLGILRMDVDGLGKIFAEGMKGSLQCFPAYATLSAQLDLYFSGYLNKIRDSKPEFRDYLNILYAGGDDLFVVGRWDLAIEFATLIRKGFRAFTGNLDNPGISGGLALIGAKFPIAKGADMAGEAEKAAKGFELEGRKKQKDAFCFLGEVVGWEEFEVVENKKKDLVKFHEQGMISTGFLYTFIQYKQIKDRHLNNYSKPPDLSFKWRSAYYLSKVADKYKDFDSDTGIHAFLKELAVDLFFRDRAYDVIALAAKWASLEIRQEENKKQENK